MNDRPMWYTLDEHETPVPLESFSMTDADSVWESMQTHVNGYFVSTVFLGIDYSFGAADPLLWETMVFKEDNDGTIDWSEEYEERYETADKARQGHTTAVEWAINQRP